MIFNGSNSNDKKNQTLKEEENIMDNNTQYNSHLLAWKQYTLKAVDSLEKGSIAEMEKYKSLADDEYSFYKQILTNEIQNESISFGFGHYIIENNLTKLVFSKDKNNKNLVGEYHKLIKEDKNLITQYFLIDSILNYPIKLMKENKENNVDDEKSLNSIKEYIEDCFDLVENKIDRKTIQESNDKVLKLIEENNLMLNKDISDDLFEIFEDVDYLVKNKKSLSNIHERRNRINSLASIIFNENKKKLNESNNSNKLTIDDFVEKYGDVLNEDEALLIKTILESKEGKEEAFNDFKDECYQRITSLLDECKDNGFKSELSQIKSTLENMEYKDDKSLFESLSKLLEIKDILSE